MEMNRKETIENSLSLIDDFKGSDSEYLELLREIIDECETRIEIVEGELE